MTIRVAVRLNIDHSYPSLPPSLLRPDSARYFTRAAIQREKPKETSDDDVSCRSAFQVYAQALEADRGDDDLPPRTLRPYRLLDGNGTGDFP